METHCGKIGRTFLKGGVDLPADKMVGQVVGRNGDGGVHGIGGVDNDYNGVDGVLGQHGVPVFAGLRERAPAPVLRITLAEGDGLVLHDVEGCHGEVEEVDAVASRSGGQRVVGGGALIEGTPVPTVRQTALGYGDILRNVVGGVDGDHNGLDGVLGHHCVPVFSGLRERAPAPGLRVALAEGDG